MSALKERRIRRIRRQRSLRAGDRAARRWLADVQQLAGLPDISDAVDEILQPLNDLYRPARRPLRLTRTRP